VDDKARYSQFATINETTPFISLSREPRILPESFTLCSLQT
jgi:hypothetical protein